MIGKIRSKALASRRQSEGISLAKTDAKPDRSDEDLMQAYKEGDTQAFQLLLSRYQKPIYNFIFKYLRNREAAEEAFQEVFLRLVKAADDYRPSAKFSTWLYTLARNFCIDQSRKNSFRNHLSLDQKDEHGEPFYHLNRLIVADSTAENVSSANELERHLHRILEELSPEQKEVFLLREVQSLSFDEIATITKVSVNTVKSRMRYALQAIQKKFQELGISSIS